METKKNENHADVSGEELVKKVEKSVKRKRKESNYLKIRNRAVNIFKNQIDKSVGTKRGSVKRAFNKIAGSEYIFDRFLAEFKENVEFLLDSKRFDKDCELHNLVPFNVATHIAFDGASKIDSVLKNGLKAIYYTRFTELVEPLFTEQELKCATEPECKGCPATTE